MSTSQPYYRKVVHPSEAGKCSSTSSFRLKVCCRRAPRVSLDASVSGIRNGKLHQPSVGCCQKRSFRECRQRIVSGTSVVVRGDIGGGRVVYKKKINIKL